MNLTDVTDEMLAKARDESLLGRLAHAKDVPLEAIGVITKRLWEDAAAEWDVLDDEVQENWNRLPIGAKQLKLQDGASMIAVLGLAGFKVVRI